MPNPIQWLKSAFARSPTSVMNMGSPVSTGRTSLPFVPRYSLISPIRSRTFNMLQTLRTIGDEPTAIDFLRKVSPDVAMAVWNFVRLSNQGHEMRIFDPKNRNARMPRAEAKWNEFEKGVNALSNAGMDGLIDMVHLSAYIKGGMGVEAVVLENRTDMEDIYPINPQTLQWRFEETVPNSDVWRWVPYQLTMYKGLIPLYPEECNFFWVPTDPDIDYPQGNYCLTPALQAIDFQLQILQDLQAVLHHQGYPRNDISIDVEKLFTIMPSEVKASQQKQKQWLMQRWNEIQGMLQGIDPDSDYIHFSDVNINMAAGANSGRGMDVRAIDELVSVQVLNGLKQMGILTNRVGGIGETESWGSLTFLIFCQGIQSIQRGSKRLLEEVCSLTLRVWGIQGIPEFIHAPVNWENEEQVYKVKLMEQQFYVIAQKMGWISNDYAAQMVCDADKAVAEPIPDAIKVSLGLTYPNLGDNIQVQGAPKKSAP